MRKENVYVNEANQQEFISKSYMRNTLHRYLKSFFNAIEYSRLEIDDGYRDLEFHRKVVDNREREAYSFLDLAEAFGVIEGDEYEILIDQIECFDLKLCIPEKTGAPDISFLLKN